MSRTVQTFVVAPEGTMEEVLNFIRETTTSVEFSQVGGSVKLGCGFEDNLDPLIDRLEAKFGPMQAGVLRTCDRAYLPK
jgi:hypothetical protein